jgi:hypothetical protein
MGGAREFTLPAKSTAKVDAGRVVGGLRIHESGGEVHFHDDDLSIKVAVPVAKMSAAWDKLSGGNKKKFKYRDPANGTELRIQIISSKKAQDVRLEVKKVSVAGPPVRSNDLKAFDSFIRGS